MSARAPAATPLPDPRHARRVPAHVPESELHRLRRAAYNLPQVVAPGDFDGDEDAAAEDRLDELGLILLQTGVAGARPSRWIAPADIDAALRHLDAVGNGREVRELMSRRAAALDAAGVSRAGGGWQRLASRPLALGAPGGELSVAYRVPVDASLVWDFFRSGDAEALAAALGPPPDYPYAEELVAHLRSLVGRAAERSAGQLDTLLPRLQAECAKPQTIAALKEATSRALERWLRRVGELDTLAELNAELAFHGYPDSFRLARRLQRRVTLRVGPPNSGKTHAAFDRLAQAENGVYLAPLRLLALEGRDRLHARGVPCSLLTGEENVPAEGARVVSSTIEMMASGKPVEVAVIDEAQMIFDASRGWAWTQAIVGVPAAEVVVICSAFAVPAIESLVALCGERLEVVRHERKQHVELLPAPVPLHAVRMGDAVVAFSRRDVLMLRDEIASSGMPVSVIYGALPPEVRRREAERYANGASHVLVATDAIGMGLNLPIRRVLFSTLAKFDGVADRLLDEAEVHQIGGRAGRYGIHEEGFVGVLKEAEPGAARLLRELMAKTPRAPRDFKAPVAPNRWHVETIASRLGLKRLRTVLGVFMEQLRLDDAHFQVAELEQMLDIAEALDENAGELGLLDRFVYAQAPVDARIEAQLQHFLDWAHRHALMGRAGSPWFLDEVDEHSRLDRMEQALRACTLWLWLDLRFPAVYGWVDEVVDLRGRLNDGIERQLKGKKPLAMRRGRRS